MTTDRELLAALETTYWKEIVAYFEALPEHQRPPSYKKYAGVREIIALSQNGHGTTITTFPSIAVSPLATTMVLPKSRSLTEQPDKRAIHKAVTAYFVHRENKPSLIRDVLVALLEQGMHIPGKVPASTLAALISRNSEGIYKKAGEGYWHLNDAYYLQNAKRFQSVKPHFENGKGANSLPSTAPFTFIPQ